MGADHRFAASGLASPHCALCSLPASDHPVVVHHIDGTMTPDARPDVLVCAACGEVFPAEQIVNFSKDGKRDQRCRGCAGFKRADPRNPRTHPLVMLAKRLDDGLIDQDEYEKELEKIL